jgi:hypothetical protein
VIKTFSFTFDGLDNFFENNIKSVSSFLESGWFILEDHRTANDHIITLENAPIIKYYVDERNGKDYNDGKSEKTPLNNPQKINMAINEAITKNENKTFLVFVEK